MPEGKVWDLYAVLAGIITTATVGNRSLGMSITNGTDIIWTSPRTGSIAASSNGELHLITGAPITSALMRIDGGSFAAYGVVAVGSLPNPCILPAGYVIRIWDVTAVDAAADDMIVVLHYVEYDA